MSRLMSFANKMDEEVLMSEEVRYVCMYMYISNGMFENLHSLTKLKGLVL